MKSGLDDANYDRNRCKEYFEAYKACRKHEVRIFIFVMFLFMLDTYTYC